MISLYNLGLEIPRVPREAWEKLVALLPNELKAGKKRKRKDVNVSCGNIGEVGGIAIRRSIVESETSVLDFVGNTQLAGLLTIIGTSCNWNLLNIKKSKIQASASDSIRLLKDPEDDTESKARVTLECRQEIGPSFLGVSIHISMTARTIVLPANESARTVKGILSL